jgi:hypothetical protein
MPRDAVEQAEKNTCNRWRSIVVQAIELRHELDPFVEALLSALPGGAESLPPGVACGLKERLYGLCKLDSASDTERVRTALQHTYQVAEAMEIMTTEARWERLSGGDLFKHLVREVEEELAGGEVREREAKFEEFLAPVRDAVQSVTPYEMVLAYLHDIGKLRTRREHEFESAAMIAGEGLLRRLGVPQDMALVLEAAIKYHLILPSIFTGSYSMLSFLPVKHDPLMRQIEERGLVGHFFDALYLISVADVAGLGKMTRVKIENFDLRSSLERVFALHGQEFRQQLYELDRERVITRLASLRCFNKMELKQEDLRRYMGYVEEARETLMTMDCFGMDEAGWAEFLHFLPRMVSFGYSIGFLYTFGATGDDGVPGSQQRISPRLFGLLAACARLMRHKEAAEGWGECLWELSFLNHPGFWDAAFKELMAWMVRDDSLQEVLKPQRVSYRDNNGIKVLVVDFHGLPPR